MSTTLHFFDRLLASANHLEFLGLTHQAYRLYRRLAAMRELPPHIARETQSRLGQILLERDRPARARKHLTAVLTHDSDDARHHFLLATAFAADAKADPERATVHFRRCLELDADNPKYLLAFARHALKHELRDEGLSLVRRALEVAAQDAAVVAQAAEELRRAGEFDEARVQLRIAIFRNGGDARFVQLWQQHQYQTLWAQQREASRDTEAEPVLLPFVARETPPRFRLVGQRVLRKDSAEPKGPHLPLRRRLPR